MPFNSARLYADSHYKDWVLKLIFETKQLVMYNITLVCTIHQELGKCNSDELHKIIESISPDVIFEELPENLFDSFYKYNQFPEEPLEVKSIKRYLQDHDIKHIPVDIRPSINLPTSQINYMFNEFQKYQVYKKIDYDINEITFRDGFTFLNGKECAELFEKKRSIEKELMNFMMNKGELLRILKMFYEEQDQREYTMVENIYNYSKENQYRQGLFLIGSAHRNSVVEKIKNFKTPDNLKFNLTFWPGKFENL